MKTFNYWKTLLVAVMAVLAFAACSDDNNGDEPGGGIPSITVDGAAEASVGVTLDGGTTKAVAVVSSGKWTLAATTAGADAWAVPSATSGSGTSSLTFAVSANAEPREATFTLTTTGMISGIPISKSAKIVVKQTKGGSSGEAIYSNNFDKSPAEKVGDKYPYLDASDAWKNATGTGNSTVTYASSGVSVRNNSNSGGYDGASGVNRIFFGANGTFSIDNITLPAGAKDFSLVFGANYFKFDTKDNVFKPENFIVTLGNGTDWSGSVTYTKIGGDDAVKPNWVYFQADFTLAEAMPELSIKFTAKEASVYAIDDVKFAEGAGGQEISFAPVVAVGKPIGEITTAGIYEVKGATVVAASPIAYMIADNTGTMVVYGNKDSRAVGDKIDISGEVTIYNATSVPQFSDAATVTVVSTGNVWTYNPTTYTATEVEAYVSNIKCVNISIEGKLIKSGTFYNLELKGTDMEGSVVYYTPDESVIGLDVTIKGYAVGTSISGGITRIKVMPYEIIPSSEPAITGAPESESFVAAGEVKTIPFNAVNLGTNKVFAKMTGTDAAQFQVATDAITSPMTVTALANATPDTKNAKLLIYIAATADGEVLDEVTVNLTQDGKLPDGAKTVEIDLAAQGYVNAVEVTTVAEAPITLTFAKGTNTSNAPKYYESGTAVRMYAANTLTVSGATITKIEYTISGTNNNFSTVSSGTYTGTEWTGSADNIVFTSNPEKVGTKNVQTHVQKVKVTYTE